MNRFKEMEHSCRSIRGQYICVDSLDDMCHVIVLSSLSINTMSYALFGDIFMPLFELDRFSTNFGAKVEGRWKAILGCT